MMTEEEAARRGVAWVLAPQLLFLAAVDAAFVTEGPSIDMPDERLEELGTVMGLASERAFLISLLIAPGFFDRWRERGWT